MSTSIFTINDIKDALERNKWSSGVTWDLNETTTYEVFDCSDMTSTHTNALLSASKVIDSKVLGENDLVLMNWNTALFTNSGNSEMYSIFNRSKNLTEWNSDLSSLTNGSYMFSYCSNLETFNSDLSNLTSGSSMFRYSALASFTSDLSSLTNGYGMFYNTALASFDSNLSSLTNGSHMFYNTALETFDSDLSSLTDGSWMFYNTTLASFDSDLSSLTDGKWMFRDCTKLTTFNSDLSSLTNGYLMFYYCTNLKSFDSDLSSLTNGSWMFYNTALASFNSDLSSLTNGEYMFYKSSLESFNSDLSSLTDGRGMFYNTALASFNSDLSSLISGYLMFDKSALTTFNSDLSSLTDGTCMFIGCKLDTASVKNIADTINTTSSGDITIGIANISPNTEEETAFNTIKNKGWNVYVNGSNWVFSDGGTGVSTGSLADDEENTTPIPYWAKPVEVDEEHATFVSSDGKYYIIQGAQFLYVSDPETYGQFTSPTHAESEIVLALGLTKYTKPTESTEDK